MQAALAKKQTHSPAKLKNLSAFNFGGLFRCPVFYKFNAQHQAFAAHIADNFMFCLELLKPGENVTPKFKRVFLQVLLLDNLQDCFANRTNNRVAAESVEVNSC